jgi:16S rRNA (guanine527-N7)-methyltransferase
MEPHLPDWIKDPAFRYLDLLDRWNRTHALTALEKADRFEELILDGAVLLPFLEPLPAGGIVADFGTGMGIPAVVLALARPDLRVFALDSSRKKIAFVRQAGLELGLANLRPVACRVEDLPPLGADLGVAKAVGTLELLAGWWARHGKPGAPFLALKGVPEAAPPGVLARTHPYWLPSRGGRVVQELRAVSG